MLPRLSFDNYKAAEIAAGKFLDDRGKPVGFAHELLVTSLDLKYEGAQIKGNPQRYDTADRAVNPYVGGGHVVAPGGWLDTTAWFLIAGDGVEKPLLLQNREAPRLVFWDDESQGYGVRYYKWVARYTVAPGEWRLIIQGNS